jgi:hypothetical protein
MKLWHKIVFIGIALLGCAYAYRQLIPVYRVDTRSELVQLGDLNHDGTWTNEDWDQAKLVLEDPWKADPEQLWQLDLNGNGSIDPDDLDILRQLISAGGDPYKAQEEAQKSGAAFPFPRELFRYVSDRQPRFRPAYGLPIPWERPGEMDWFGEFRMPKGQADYGALLDRDLWDESVRLIRAYRRRSARLEPLEIEHMQAKLAQARRQWADGRQLETLLTLTGLVEDGETITTRGQPAIALQVLLFRDHLRELLRSPEIETLKTTRDRKPLFHRLERHLADDLGLHGYDIEKLKKPRNLASLRNYVERAEWQYHKSSSKTDDFLTLIAFAQNDRRYVRAASHTGRKHSDVLVENHNLPMVLLYREALRIAGGNQKRAIGLLDETLRIPYAWIKSVPKQLLPGALGLENFLLPGNKEDGADKSRHWNVFGGISLYKSPQEAVDLAVKREVQDMRDAGFSPEAIEENLRDLISDMNGIYHVLSVSPRLID